MGAYFLSDKQRQELTHFPEKLEDDELIQYFTLTSSDLKCIPPKMAPHLRLGFGISLCTLRFLGFIPDDLCSIPSKVIEFVSAQLKLKPNNTSLEKYGTRSQTKTGHMRVIENHLGFSRFTQAYRQALEKWLLKRALEHDRPTLLLKFTTDKLQRDRVVRTSLKQLERLVGLIRDRAKHETYKSLSSFLSPECRNFLDSLLITNNTDKNIVPLTWLKQRAVSHSPESILVSLSKLSYLKEAGVDTWDLSHLNANRLKTLHRIGKCSTNQALQ